MCKRAESVDVSFTFFLRFATTITLLLNLGACTNQRTNFMRGFGVVCRVFLCSCVFLCVCICLSAHGTSEYASMNFTRGNDRPKINLENCALVFDNETDQKMEEVRQGNGKASL